MNDSIVIICYDECDGNISPFFALSLNKFIFIWRSRSFPDTRLTFTSCLSFSALFPLDICSKWDGGVVNSILSSFYCFLRHLYFSFSFSLSLSSKTILYFVYNSLFPSYFLFISLQHAIQNGGYIRADDFETTLWKDIRWNKFHFDTIKFCIPSQNFTSWLKFYVNTKCTVNYDFVILTVVSLYVLNKIPLPMFCEGGKQQK